MVGGLKIFHVKNVFAKREAIACLSVSAQISVLSRKLVANAKVKEKPKIVNQRNTSVSKIT